MAIVRTTIMSAYLSYEAAKAAAAKVSYLASPISIPHAFDGTRPDVFGVRCRACGMLPVAALHQPGIPNHDPGDEDVQR
mgnify:CR=1 FL=1